MAPDILESEVQKKGTLSRNSDTPSSNIGRLTRASILALGVAVTGNAFAANRDTINEKPTIIGDPVSLVSNPVYQRIPEGQRGLFVDAFGNMQTAAKKSPNKIQYALYTKTLEGSPDRNGNIYTGLNPDAFRTGLSNEVGSAKVFGLKAITGEDKITVENLPKIFSVIMPKDSADVSYMRNYNNEKLTPEALEYRRIKELEANQIYNGHAEKLPQKTREDIVIIANQVVNMIPLNKQTQGVLARVLRNVVDVGILGTRIDRDQVSKMSIDAILNTGNAIGELIYLTSFGQGIVDKHGYRNPKAGVTGENQTIEFITYQTARTIPIVGEKIDAVNTLYGKGFGTLVVGTLNQKSDSVLAGVEARIAEERKIASQANIATSQTNIAEGRARIDMMNNIMVNYELFEKMYARYSRGQASREELVKAFNDLIKYEGQLRLLKPDEQAGARNYFISAKNKINS